MNAAMDVCVVSRTIVSLTLLLVKEVSEYSGLTVSVTVSAKKNAKRKTQTRILQQPPIRVL